MDVFALTLIAVLVLIAVFIFAAIGYLIYRRRQTAAPAKPAPSSSTGKKKRKKKKKRPDATDSNGAAPSTDGKEAAPAAAKPAGNNAKVSSPALAMQVEDMNVGDKVRILVVDDNADTRDHVDRLLYFEKDLEVIGHGLNGREGIELAMKLRPHIVLMDINMPDMDGITATKEMSVKAPYSQVIIMSVQSDQHYMRQAMAAGARDFQPKPFTIDELVNTIRRVYKISLPMYHQMDTALEAEKQGGEQVADTSSGSSDIGSSDTPVVVLYSPKGGVGTSTLAINLAIAIQREYGEVVLMDGNLQFGDIAVNLNLKTKRTMIDVIHEGQLDLELLPEIVLPHSSGLKVLLAPPRPELAEIVTPEMVVDIVKGLRQHFKLVIVDTSHMLNDHILGVLEAASQVLLVTIPELTAVKGAKQFIELTQDLELNIPRLNVLINRAGQSGGISVKKIQGVLKVQQSYEVPYDPRLHLAINRGVAVTQEEIGAPSAQKIIEIGHNLWETLGAGQAELV